jgi:hypothetical protein
VNLSLNGSAVCSEQVVLAAEHTRIFKKALRFCSGPKGLVPIRRSTSEPSSVIVFNFFQVSRRRERKKTQRENKLRVSIVLPVAGLNPIYSGYSASEAR